MAPAGEIDTQQTAPLGDSLALETEAAPVKELESSAAAIERNDEGGSDSEAEELAADAGPAPGAAAPRTTAIGCAWEENTPSCGVCGVRFQKLRMTRRHHCRVCGKCVCSACSPSTIQLEGHKALQRACTPCVAHAVKARAATDRLQVLAGRLHEAAGEGGGIATAIAEPELERASGEDELEVALARCEAAAAPLEALRDRLGVAEQRLQNLAGAAVGPQPSAVLAPSTQARAASLPGAGGEQPDAEQPGAGGEQPMVACQRQDWEENTAACALCATAFSPFRRRHHCRICGICVCLPCSGNTVRIEGREQKERACNRCVAQRSSTC